MQVMERRDDNVHTTPPNARSTLMVAWPCSGSLDLLGAGREQGSRLYPCLASPPSHTLHPPLQSPSSLSLSCC
ncbi:hypothetical protein Pmani_016463 [Petrolisthes manimaculis]|uniref:Uncharacterized protein n=1 Tax=Petrolisthes manimaculis TaxID=1843537 RepID=A0AAE1UB07_9EUCA|nr:hypothetical protein Pmani_016463 [Petrolisthes manimaculis]